MSIKISKSWIRAAIPLCCVLLVSFVRGFSGTIFKTTTSIIVTMVFVVLLSLYEIINKKIKLNYLDLCWIVVLLLYLFWRESGKYSLAFASIILAAFFVSFMMRAHLDCYSIICKLVLLFSLLSVVATWLQILLPGIYFSTVINLFPLDMQQTIRQEYKAGYYSGLTYHYSPNAFYILNGFFVLISELFMDKKLKYKKGKIVTCGIQIITLCVLGKRGHLLFLLLAVLISYMAVQPNLSKKIKKASKFIFVLVICALAIFTFIPQARFILDRIVKMSVSGDITTGRSQLYVIAWSMFYDSPLFGNKIGAFSLYTNLAYNGVHNDYLQLLCETGLIGFSVFLVANICTLIKTYKKLKITQSLQFDGSRAKYIMYSFMFQVFFLTYSFTGLPRFDYEICIIYILLCSIPAAIGYWMR